MTGRWAGKTYWLVGASEGLGRALAEELATAGASLCLSARNAERLQALAETLPGKHIVAACDVRDSASVRVAFDALPPLDGVICNAGFYEPVNASAWDADAVEAMCDVNLTGAARVLGSAVPALVARGKGHIALVGSLAGYRGLPGSIGYGSSKAGVIHLAESIRCDLPRDRFKVQVINPGFIETRLTAKNDFRMPFIMTAEAAALRTRKALESNRFRTNYPRRFALLFRLAQLLPDWAYVRAMGASPERPADSI